MAFDVDGVLTDGGLFYAGRAEGARRFHVHDGLGLQLLARAGIVTALVSARRSAALARRAVELGVAHCLQGVADKGAALAALLARLGLQATAAGYMGDDLPDLPAFARCGFACAPPEAVAPVRACAHYVARRPAGAGAVRDVCEYVLEAQGRLAPLLAAYRR